MPIVRVALDVPLHRLFDYQLADACPADVGRRVRVPFGRGEKIGVVVAVAVLVGVGIGPLLPTMAN